jgi:hypothetical protein
MKRATVMKKISLLLAGLLMVSGSVVLSQDRNGFMDLIAGSHSHMYESDAGPVAVATTGSYAEMNGYLELKKGVDDAIIEPDYESRFKAFGVSNEELGKMIVVHPNPVVDRFQLKIPREIGEVVSAGVYNMEGDKVRGFGKRLEGRKSAEIEMNACDLVPGLYFIRIETEFGKVSRSFTVK